jgi:hypothetical protein
MIDTNRQPRLRFRIDTNEGLDQVRDPLEKGLRISMSPGIPDMDTVRGGAPRPGESGG